MTDKDTQKHRSGRVERRINTARDSLPGERNDLPEGALRRRADGAAGR